MRPPPPTAFRSMSASRFVLLALLSLQLAGCGERPRLEPLPESAVVLAFGDSLTFGTGANEDESYPARLAATLDEYQPRLLLLCIGGNDFLRRIDLRQAENNVRAMVKLAKDRGIGVVLIGTPEPGLMLNPPGFYSAIAREFRVPYEAAVIRDVLKDENLKSDPIHPNARGYRVIAERLAAVLKESGAI